MQHQDQIEGRRRGEGADTSDSKRDVGQATRVTASAGGGIAQPFRRPNLGSLAFGLLMIGLRGDEAGAEEEQAA